MLPLPRAEVPVLDHREVDRHPEAVPVQVLQDQVPALQAVDLHREAAHLPDQVQDQEADRLREVQAAPEVLQAADLRQVVLDPLRPVLRGAAEVPLQAEVILMRERPMPDLVPNNAMMISAPAMSNARAFPPAIRMIVRGRAIVSIRSVKRRVRVPATDPFARHRP